ncbi:site-specific integrase [Mucilaginibacter daejeonensis]|uniref:site-specific integrase n=1 Tax=Mucilaginibacter daejeonensis TaxID=398049 RepID=UPI001D171554|nr:site-specific integrase [Mucilaginibacter daejeonensis]UEG54044.1 site-specific integrase [Mucilaginibacter daejeonensis]
MRTTRSFRVYFTIKTDKAKNGKAPLYAAVTVNKEKAFIALKQQVSLMVWDIGKGAAKGTREEAKAINTYLDEVRLNLGNCYKELLLKGKLLTPKAVKSLFLGETDETFTLNKLMAYHNDTAGKSLDPATMKQYHVTQRYLISYVRDHYQADDLLLRDLGHGFIQGFDAFLRAHRPKDHHKPLNDNGVKVHLKRLKKMVHLGKDMQWIEGDPFATFKIKMKKVAREYLTDSELKAIEQKVFDLERLALIKDLFIFSCYTGLAYGDLMALRPAQIANMENGERWIRTIREKTNEPVNVPLLPKASELIDKYRYNERSLYNGRVFPLLSNQKVNSYLKEIAEFCGIHKNLTFHMARHTFATTVTLSNGVPIETVSKILGHAKVATTQIYARVVENKLRADMRSLRHRLQLNEEKSED